MTGVTTMRETACREFEEDLVLHYYGETSGAERDRVEAHLEACSGCRSFITDLHRLLPQMAKQKELPMGFWDRYHREVMQKIAADQERRSWWRNWIAPAWSWTVPAFGATIVLVLGLTFTLGKSPWHSVSDSKQATIPQEILADPNKVEFFKSMELVESLRALEALDGSTGQAKHARSS